MVYGGLVVYGGGSSAFPGSIFTPTTMASPSNPPDLHVKPYLYYFRNVFSQRMRYVNKIAFFLAVLLSVLLTRHKTWALKTFALVYEVPLYTVALQVVKVSRIHNSTVVYSDAKSLGRHLLKTASSWPFWASVFATAFSALCLMVPFLPQSNVLYYLFSKEYRHKPLVNDQFVYFLFHSMAVGALHNVQYMVFQRNRLAFTYGVPNSPPARYLFAPVARLAAGSLTFTVATFLFVPVMYLLLHLTVYRMLWPMLVLFNLDTRSAPLWTFLDFGFLLRMAWYSWVVFFVLEFFNHAFNTYATIGCLHHARPISLASSNPVITLLSGVRDVRPLDLVSALLKVGAFQELAYIASSPDPEAREYRNKIFNAKSSAISHSFWPSILDECSLVIKNTSSRVNYRLSSDLSALRNVDVKAPEPESDEFIFGNSSGPKIETSANGAFPNAPSANGSFAKESMLNSTPLVNRVYPKDLSFNDSLNDTTNLAISATSSPVKKYDDPQLAHLAHVAASTLQKTPVSQTRATLLKAVHILDSQILVPLNNCLLRLSGNSKLWTPSGARLSTRLAAHYDQLLHTQIGLLWRTTLKRDSESRVLDPVTYGNAVLTLSGLLLRSIEEDRSNTISNASLSEVLNLLEKPIRAFANYTDYLPASVYKPSTSKHLVAIMHDLTVKEYYQLAVKFNYKLSDLQLSPRAFKLAKWAVAASLASTDARAHHASVHI